MRKNLLCFLFVVSFLQGAQDVYAQNSKPVLIYNMFPPSFGMGVGKGLEYFDKMTAYLPIVKNMGFNTVWLSPFNETSDVPAKVSFDVGVDREVICSHSIYSPHDFSRIEGEPLAPSTGNPGYASPIAIEKITKFTSKAKELGLDLLFDLPVAYIPDGSPLACGSFSYFKNKGVDTSKWFNNTSTCWWKPLNGAKIIDYDNLDIRREIFQELWAPYIHKMMSVFGFKGVRFDFAGALQPDFLKWCIDYMKSLNSNAIIFGEMLVGSLLEHIEHRKECGFTHITNSALWVRRNHIGSKGAFEWFLKDIGLKKQICHNTLTNYYAGTIGFAGSHDDGTALQAACRVRDRSGYGGSGNFWCILNMTLLDFSIERKLSLAKERLAIAAFTSDAGYYVMSGDDSLSVIKKNVFLETRSLLQNHSEDSLYDAAAPQSPQVMELREYVKRINALFMKLRQATEVFWLEVLQYDEKSMIFVRHLSKGYDGPTDIVFADYRQCSSKDLFPQVNDIKLFVVRKTEHKLSNYCALHGLTSRNYLPAK